jgi:RNA polymerase sigma factor (sigma-70 family)
VTEKPMNDLDELIPTRQSLLLRLKDLSDNESWKEFFEIYWKLIYRTGVKSGLKDEEAQDLVQETMVSVFKAMPNFEYRQTAASFKGWLLRLTAWRIRDLLRKREPDFVRLQGSAEKSSDDPKTGTVERIADPASLRVESNWDLDWDANLMEAAIARVKNLVDPKAYQLFDLAVLKEWPISKIAESMNVSATLVYVAKHRVAKQLRKELRFLENFPIHLSNADKQALRE